MYLSITLLCVAIVPGCFSYEEIHKYMSSEEVRHVFQTDVNSVPEYQVVKLHMSERLHRRDLSSGRHIHTVAFGENINLWLHPADSILAGRHTPVYYAKRSSSKRRGVEYRLQYGLMDVVGRIFEDPEKMASMVIGTDDSGRTRVNGFIESKRLSIKSLPRRVVDEYSRRRRSIDGPEDPQYSPYHIVIRMNETGAENYSHSPVNETRLRERFARSVEAIPDILYPEVLVVVENSAYIAYDTPYGYDIYGLLQYLLAFWNGVDLKYRSVNTPKIRIHIAAIVLGEDAGATPYIDNNMVSSKAFNTSRAMPDSQAFWYGVKDTFPLDSYDIAATMTRHDFGLDAYIIGQAYLGAACQIDDGGKKIRAVSIFQDDGVFSGVQVIAHELGHVFGANHDYDEEDCVSKYGFLMAGSLRFTTNSSDLSPCSMRQVQQRLDAQKLTCLYNRPIVHDQSLPRLMPGRVKDVHAQCESLSGGSSCQDKYPQHNVCMKMFCRTKEGDCTNTGAWALDGTRCGSEKDFCLHQRCVSL